MNKRFYENLNLDPRFEASAAKIILTGYGGSGGCLGFAAANLEILPNSHFLKVDQCLAGGDSGGPAIHQRPITDRVSDIRIVGVNARQNCAESFSILTSTSRESTRQWVRNWIARKNVEVCGVNAQTVRCRKR